MPRTARFLPDNVCYHIIARGNQRQKIFINVSDYNYYVRLLKKYKTKFNIAIYGFCLMPNHVHFIVQPGESNCLSHFMKGLNQTYAQYFNERYQKCGHLWQERFKSIIIDKENYLFDCIKYVEFNPVRAELAKSPSAYHWSSYQNRVLGKKDGVLDSLDDLFTTKRDRPQAKRGTVPHSAKGLSLIHRF